MTLPKTIAVARCRLHFAIAALLMVLVFCSPVDAQFNSTTEFTLSQAQLDVVGSDVTGELAAIEALLADSRWDEAVERLRALGSLPHASVITADEATGLYISLADHVQRRLAHLPQPAMQLYRARVDSLAKSWYEQGVAHRDERLLNRVVNEFFASSFADDALFALGELALVRGDYSAARRYWERITPVARDPDGRPWWITLHHIDVAEQWHLIEPVYQASAKRVDGFVYPDTNLPVAEVWGRLVLVSIRSGAIDRAQRELALLERAHPNAIGRWGGKSVELTATLRQAVEQALLQQQDSLPNDSPTFAGQPSRNGRGPSLPPISTVLWRVELADGARADSLRGASRVSRNSTRRLNAGGDAVLVHPIVVGDTLLYSDRDRVYALDVTTGKSALPTRSDAVLYAPQREPTRSTFHPGRGRLGMPRYTLTAHDGTVYARMGSAVTTRVESTRLTGDERLVGLQLAGQGRIEFSAEATGSDGAFDGAPLVDDENIYVALRQSDVRPRSLVACYDRYTRRLKWHRFIASADTAARTGWEEVTHNLLTLVGDTIYFNTNLGAIAALSTHDGSLRWIKRYDRAAGGDYDDLAPHFRRALAPCLVDRGIVYCAPSDSPFLFALDATTGETMWATDALTEAVHLLGVAENRLIVSGERLWWIDALDGKVVHRWPEGRGSGVRGYGRGMLAQDAILWPTKQQRIFVFDIESGQQQREAIDLRVHDVASGNLQVTKEMLIVTSTDQIVALGVGQKPAEPGEADVARSSGQLVTQ